MKRLLAASCPAITGPTLQEHLWDPRGQNLTWGPGLGPESPPCRLLSKYHGPKWGSDPSTSESLVLFNSTMGPEGPGENKVPIYPQTQLGRKFGRAQLG